MFNIQRPNVKLLTSMLIEFKFDLYDLVLVSDFELDFELDSDLDFQSTLTLT